MCVEELKTRYSKDRNHRRVKESKFETSAYQAEQFVIDLQESPEADMGLEVSANESENLDSFPLDFDLKIHQ